MSSFLDHNSLQDAVILIGVIGSTLLYYKARLPRQTIKDLQAHASAQDLTIKDLQSNNVELIKTVASLEGQIKVYKDLPLRELAEGIKQNNLISTSILNELQKSATIIAEDKGMLSNK